MKKFTLFPLASEKYGVLAIGITDGDEARAYTGKDWVKVDLKPGDEIIDRGEITAEGFSHAIDLLLSKTRYDQMMKKISTLESEVNRLNAALDRAKLYKGKKRG